jgi:hypothetical protein
MRRRDSRRAPVDGKEVILHRMDGPGSYQSVELGLNNTGIQVHEVGIRLLGQKAEGKP